MILFLGFSIIAVKVHQMFSLCGFSLRWIYNAFDSLEILLWNLCFLQNSGVLNGRFVHLFWSFQFGGP